MPWSEANKIWWKQYYNSNKEYRKALTRTWRKKNPEKTRSYNKKYESTPADKAKKREWAKNNRAKLLFQYKARVSAIRGKVIDGYGGKCACCGETEYVFLAIDHVNDDGNVERKNLKGGSWGFYSRIIKGGFPDRYQVLCHNCNWAKRLGGCPHKKM